MIAWKSKIHGRNWQDHINPHHTKWTQSSFSTNICRQCADNVQTNLSMCRQTRHAQTICLHMCADKARQTADKLQTKPAVCLQFVWLCLHTCADKLVCLHIVCACLVCLHIVGTCLVCLHIACTLSAIDLWTHIVLSITISHVQSKELAWLGIWRWRSHPGA